jgi:hypothetical protein
MKHSRLVFGAILALFAFAANALGVDISHIALPVLPLVWLVRSVWI